MRRFFHNLLFMASIFAAGSFDAVSASPQGGGAPPPAATIVKPHAFVSLDPVPRGQKFEIAVVAEIKPGFHMNSNHPTDEYLIPTTLSAQLPPWLKQAEVVYPAGDMKKFSFSDKPLSVYSSKVTLLLMVEAAPSAPLGAQSVSLSLRYQACNDTACLPPVKIPVEVKLQIAPAGSRGRPANPDVFSKQGTKASH